MSDSQSDITKTKYMYSLDKNTPFLSFPFLSFPFLSSPLLSWLWKTALAPFGLKKQQPFNHFVSYLSCYLCSKKIKLVDTKHSSGSGVGVVAVWYITNIFQVTCLKLTSTLHNKQYNIQSESLFIQEGFTVLSTHATPCLSLIRLKPHSNLRQPQICTISQ